MNRGLFATHYHRLADAYAGSEAVAVMHMQAVVSIADDGLEQASKNFAILSHHIWASNNLIRLVSSV